MTEVTATWLCACGERREVPSQYVGDGAPACSKCGAAMVRKPVYGEPRSALLLLLEALEREQGPHDPRAIRINCSEYSYDIARHAKECLVELRKMYREGKA